MFQPIIMFASTSKDIAYPGLTGFHSFYIYWFEELLEINYQIYYKIIVILELCKSLETYELENAFIGNALLPKLFDGHIYKTSMNTVRSKLF